MSAESPKIVTVPAALVGGPGAPGWELKIRTTRAGEATAHTLTARSGAPVAVPVSVGMEWTFDGWRDDIYVLLPGALYAGNRFEALKVPYSPRYPAERAGPDMPLLISDVPRLERNPALPSRVQLLAGDLAWPAFAWWDPRAGKAFLLTAPSHTTWGQTGWELAEPAGHARLSFRLTAPGIRTRRYAHMRTDHPSQDSGYMPRPGEELRLTARVEEWSAPRIGDFFARVFARWHAELRPDSIPATFSLSQAYDLIVEKYERENWVADWGLYLTVPDPANRYPYQTGWCGGGIAAHALLSAPAPCVRAHARENIDRIATEGVAPCGLIFGKRNREGWISDFHGQEQHPHTARWTLARRQGDALYYLAKAIAFEEQDNGHALPADHPWKQALRRLADALARAWQADGQWGHFLDQFSGRVAVGGTCSGAIIPAGLALAHQLLGEPAWLETALGGARDFLENWTRRGLTAGGPGDALGCMDSESAAALVESYTRLWQVTGDREWLAAAVEAAHQLATWVMPYAYPFPHDTEFGRLGMNTTGTVFANVQNKHSAPGICTHSGEAMLRLFRATGDRRLLDLLTAVARALPQYVSRPGRPIHDPNGRALPFGWINERVNTSDWDHNLGGVFHGSCWCEVSLLLTFAELPGVYWQPDTGVLAVLDHVEAEVRGGKLLVRNPLAAPLRARVRVETAQQARRPDPILTPAGTWLQLGPGEQAAVTV